MEIAPNLTPVLGRSVRPEEDLVSLIYFYEANHDAVVAPLSPPIGRVSGLEPVTSSEFIKERLDSITVD